MDEGWAEGGPVSEAALSDRRPLPPARRRCSLPDLEPYLSQSSKLWSPNRNVAHRPSIFTSLKLSANVAPGSTV